MNKKAFADRMNKQTAKSWVVSRGGLWRVAGGGMMRQHLYGTQQTHGVGPTKNDQFLRVVKWGENLPF